MSRPLIVWNGELTDLALYRFCEEVGLLDPVPYQCGECAGMGTTLEEFDRERLPEAVRCWRCKGKGWLMTKPIEAEWLNYRRDVVPENAGVMQVVEPKRAFFAGAWAYYQLLMRGLSPGSDAAPSDETLMLEVRDELLAYQADVAGGRA